MPVTLKVSIKYEKIVEGDLAPNTGLTVKLYSNDGLDTELYELQDLSSVGVYSHDAVEEGSYQVWDDADGSFSYSERIVIVGKTDAYSIKHGSISEDHLDFDAVTSATFSSHVSNESNAHGIDGIVSSLTSLDGEVSSLQSAVDGHSVIVANASDHMDLASGENPHGLNPASIGILSDVGGKTPSINSAHQQEVTLSVKAQPITLTSEVEGIDDREAIGSWVVEYAFYSSTPVVGSEVYDETMTCPSSFIQIPKPNPESSIYSEGTAGKGVLVYRVKLVSIDGTVSNFSSRNDLVFDKPSLTLENLAYNIKSDSSTLELLANLIRESVVIETYTQPAEE